MLQFRYESQSDQQTRLLGRSFGLRASPGELICLNGELGAGKTTFVQGIADGLGLNRHSITSPTYSLIAEHRDGRIPLIHMDAYRLSELAELGPIGFDEYLYESGGLMVIEWSHRIAGALPDERINILIETFAKVDTRRLFLIEPIGDREERLVREALAST